MNVLLTNSSFQRVSEIPAASKVELFMTLVNGFRY